jgi:hypothetical protein
MTDTKAEKTPPVPVEMQAVKGADGKASEAAVPAPLDDPNVAKLADDLHANA